MKKGAAGRRHPLLYLFARGPCPAHRAQIPDACFEQPALGDRPAPAALTQDFGLHHDQVWLDLVKPRPLLRERVVVQLQSDRLVVVGRVELGSEAAPGGGFYRAVDVPQTGRRYLQCHDLANPHHHVP
jgi:hypothetical protein